MWSQIWFVLDLMQINHILLNQFLSLFGLISSPIVWWGSDAFLYRAPPNIDPPSKKLGHFPKSWCKNAENDERQQPCAPPGRLRDDGERHNHLLGQDGHSHHQQVKLWKENGKLSLNKKKWKSTFNPSPITGWQLFKPISAQNTIRWLDGVYDWHIERLRTMGGLLLTEKRLILSRPLFQPGRADLPKIHDLAANVRVLVTQGISVNSSYSSDVQVDTGQLVVYEE